MRPVTEWHHVWVEWHVRLWESIGLIEPVRVPKWYAKVWNYPDGSFGDRPHKWETLGYHVGHWTAVLPALLLLGLL